MSFVETNISSHQYEPELWRPEIKTRRVNTREVLLPFFLGSSFDFDSLFSFSLTQNKETQPNLPLKKYFSHSIFDILGHSNASFDIKKANQPNFQQEKESRGGGVYR